MGFKNLAFLAILAPVALAGCSKVFVNISKNGSQNQWPYYQCQNQIFVAGNFMSYAPSYVPPGSTFSVNAGAFPAGINLDPLTGVISGMATGNVAPVPISLTISSPSGMPYFTTIQVQAENGTVLASGGQLNTAITGATAGGYAIVMGAGLYSLNPSAVTPLIYPIDFYGDCQGNGTSVIDGTNSFGINPDSNLNLSFNNLVIQNFTSVSGWGAIWNIGDTGNSHWNFNNVTFTGNKTSSVNEGGGAIDFYESGTGGNSSITVNNCTFTNNQTTGTGGAGGAIYVSAISNMTLNFSVQQSVFFGNSNAAASGFGGAIAMSTIGSGIILGSGFSPPSLISQSLFSNNTAPFGGAIYYNAANAINPVIVNSTFFQNGSATTNASAVYSSGSPKLWNNTFAANMATGGTIFQLDTGTMTLWGNIFAFTNTGGSCAGGPTFFVTNGYNLFDEGSPTCTSFMTTEYGSPNLGPLQWNGGQQNLLTMAPRSGSAAIDRIPFSSGDCPMMDEVNNPRGMDGSCDAGAFETGNYNF